MRNCVRQHDVTVRYRDQVQKLIITVVDGDSPSLLGRDWLKQLLLNWTQMSMVQNSSKELEDLMKNILIFGGWVRDSMRLPSFLAPEGLTLAKVLPTKTSAICNSRCHWA